MTRVEKHENKNKKTAVKVFKRSTIIGACGTTSWLFIKIATISIPQGLSSSIIQEMKTFKRGRGFLEGTRRGARRGSIDGQ